MTAEFISSIDGIVKFDGVEIDFSGNTIAKDGQTKSVEPKVMAVLAMLVSRAGQVVTREEILDKVWPTETGGDEGLSRNISVLRNELGDERPYQTIKTIPKKGYRFDAEVEFPESHFESLKSQAIDITERLKHREDPPDTKNRNWPKAMVFASVGAVAVFSASAFAVYSSGRPENVQNEVQAPTIDRRAIRSAMQVLVSHNRPVDAAVAALVETGDFDQAISKLHDAHNTQESTQTISQSAEILHQVGALAFDRQQEVALSAYKELVGMDESDWLASYQLARIHYDRNEKAESAIHLERAMSSDSLTPRDMFNLEMLEMRIEGTDYPKTSELFFQKAEEARALGFEDCWASATYFGVKYDILVKDYSVEANRQTLPTMLAHIDMVIETQRALSLVNEMSRSINTRGLILYLSERFEEAEQAYLEALAIERVLQRPNRLHAGLSNLARLMLDQQRISEAEAYNEEAIAILRSVGLFRNMPYNWSLAAQISETTGRQEEACNTIEKALAMHDELLLPIDRLRDWNAQVQCEGKPG